MKRIVLRIILSTALVSPLAAEAVSACTGLFMDSGCCCTLPEAKTSKSSGSMCDLQAKNDCGCNLNTKSSPSNPTDGYLPAGSHPVLAAQLIMGKPASSKTSLWGSLHRPVTAQNSSQSPPGLRAPPIL